MLLKRYDLFLINNKQNDEVKKEVSEFIKEQKRELNIDELKTMFNID